MDIESTISRMIPLIKHTPLHQSQQFLSQIYWVFPKKREKEEKRLPEASLRQEVVIALDTDASDESNTKWEKAFYSPKKPLKQLATDHADPKFKAGEVRKLGNEAECWQIEGKIEQEHTNKKPSGDGCLWRWLKWSGIWTSCIQVMMRNQIQMMQVTSLIEVMMCLFWEHPPGRVVGLGTQDKSQ